MTDQVNGPDHYTAGDIECIDAIRSQLGHVGFIAYCHGNVAKYIWRWHHKGGAQDLAKAKKYIDWMMDEISDGEDRPPKNSGIASTAYDRMTKLTEEQARHLHNAMAEGEET